MDLLSLITKTPKYDPTQWPRVVDILLDHITIQNDRNTKVIDFQNVSPVMTLKASDFVNSFVFIWICAVGCEGYLAPSEKDLPYPGEKVWPFEECFRKISCSMKSTKMKKWRKTLLDFWTHFSVIVWQNLICSYVFNSYTIQLYHSVFKSSFCQNITFCEVGICEKQRYLWMVLTFFTFSTRSPGGKYHS